MDSFLNKIPGSRSGPGTANTVVGSTAAIVGILGVAAVSTTAPVTGAIIGLAGGRRCRRFAVSKITGQR